MSIDSEKTQSRFLFKPYLIIKNTLKKILAEQKRLELKKLPANKGKAPAFADVNPIWLALLNDFRTFDWAEEYKYPTVVLDQMKVLLAKYENL